MSEQKSDICPICGNNRQNGRCLRCAAIASSRSKRWRTGDRGGVRPERRLRGSSASRLAPPVRPGSTVGTKPQPRNRSKLDINLAIHGEWLNLHSNKTIQIDIMRNTWSFRNKHGRRQRQKWHKRKVSHNELRFFRRRQKIIARVAGNGLLVLKEGNREVSFAAIRGGKRHRTCPNCFYKFPWQGKYCNNCGRFFSRLDKMGNLLRNDHD